MPRWVQISARTGHLVLSAIAIIAIATVYIWKGQVPAEVLIGILGGNSIGGLSSAVVSAADKVSVIPVQNAKPEGQ